MSNVYYSPEGLGLVPVASIDYSDGNYVFDIRAVWKDSSGAFYTARDSGCSCPSPFEDYNDLTSLDRLDLAALEAEVADERRGGGSCEGAHAYSDFLRAVKEAAGHAFHGIADERIECPMCGRSALRTDDDYVCIECRMEMAC